MFKKRESIDILDIPELHRKKLIKLPEPQKHDETKITNDGYFVLNSNQKQEITEVKPELKQEASQVTSFLSDFASIGSSNESNQSTQEIKQESSEVKDLKWRLENLEFKLEQLIERVNSFNR